MHIGDSIFATGFAQFSTVLVFEFAIFEKYANMKPYETDLKLTFVSAIQCH